MPRTTSGTWLQIEYLLFYLAVVFGVVEVPKTTVYGVWRGKGGGDWRDERLEVDCRSTMISPQLEADLSIVEPYEELEMQEMRQSITTHTHWF